MVTKNSTVSDTEIADAARNFFRLLAMASPTVAKVAKEAVAEAVEEDIEEADEDVELEELDREETEALSIKDLRLLAKKYGVDSIKKAEILEGLEEFFADSDEDEDEDADADEDEDAEADSDDDEDDEDEDDEESELDRDELSELSLKELRIEAKNAGHAAAEYRGMDQDALIDLILGEDDEEADEDEEEADDEDDDEDVEELDEDALNAMSLVELKELAKEIGITVKVPVTAKTDLKKKKVYVAAVLDSAEE